jgi:iron(III) transport system substrate-binding protein
VLSSLLISGVGSVAPSAGASTAKVPLVIYAAEGYDSAMSKAFETKTGIPVQLDDNSTGPLLTQIEASKNNPKWGLLWVDGPTAFAGLDTQHILLRNFEPSVSWNSLGTQSVPHDKSYIPTGVTLTAAVVYNSTVVKDPPKTWADLLSPTWKGAVGMNDPSQSGPTYPFIAGMMNYLGGTNGVAKGESFFSKLKANGLVINPTNGPTLQALASGQIKLALVQSSAGIGAQATDPTFKVAYLDPITLLPSAIGIDAKASKTEQSEAEQFATFALSKAGQRVMQAGDPSGDGLFYPVINGVSAEAAVPSLSKVKVQTINPYTWGPRESAINTWFDTNIVQ